MILANVALSLGRRLVEQKRGNTRFSDPFISLPPPLLPSLRVLFRFVITTLRATLCRQPCRRVAIFCTWGICAASVFSSCRRPFFFFFFALSLGRWVGRSLSCCIYRFFLFIVDLFFSFFFFLFLSLIVPGICWCLLFMDAARSRSRLEHNRA